MDIFVQSRGQSPDFEYCWQPEVPPHLTTISSLIQCESPSVVLARFHKKLMLLATGLDSPEKRDFRGRRIRHSVAWVIDESYENEPQIRAIAIQALQGLLTNSVDKYIRFGGENGFEASISEIERLSQSFLAEEIMGNLSLPSSELPPKIGKHSQDLRDDLVSKLQQYLLPNGYELIVVTTGIKSEDSLKKAGAWRSLSNLAKSENWRELSKSEAQSPNFFRAAITVLIVLVVLLLMLISQLTQKTPSLSPAKPSTSLEMSLPPMKKDLLPSAN
jgi:hypothetical protein